MPVWLNVTVMIFIVWALLIAFKKVRTKKGDLDSLVFVAALGAYLLFDVYALTEVPGFILDILIYGGFFLTVFLFNIREVFAKDVTKEKLNALNKEYRKLSDRSEMLRMRFVHLLDMVDSGIMFRSEDGSVFGTDQLLEIVNFENNEFSFDELLHIMHPDDKRTYMEVLERLGKKRSTYTVHYRLNKETGYTWFKERGTYLKHKGKPMYIALVDALDIKAYPKSNIEVLNNLTIGESYFEHLQKLSRKGSPYTIVTFEISNIPQINNRYGRDIGDLMMGEYLSKLSYQFLKDIHAVFRLGGIRFAMVIEDQRKAQMLKRALEEGGDLINYTMQFGAAKESVFPAFGMLEVKHFDEPIDEIAARAEKALEIALDEKTQDIYFVIS